MKSAHELQLEIDDKNAKVESILAVCREENREPDSEEQVEIDGAYGTDGKPGAIEQLQNKMKNRAAIESRQREIAAAKLGGTVQRHHNAVKDRVVVPARAKRHLALKNFANDDAGEKEAYVCGQYLLANVFNHAPAKQFLKEHGIMNAQKEASTLGLEFVPEPLEAALLKRLQALCPILSKVRTSTMVSATHRIPDRLTGTTVYYPAELAAVTESNLTFAQITLTARKMAALTQISNEVEADGVISMVDTVIDDFAHQMAVKIEDDIFNGDGTSTYGSVTGLANALGAGSLITASGTGVGSFTLANFEDAVGLNPFYQGSNQEWYMSMFTYSQSVLPLLNAAGGTPGTEMTNGWRPALFGFPINICQAMPSADAVSTSFVYFGDMSQSVFYGQRQGVSIATSTDYAFNTDSIYVRAIARNAVTVDNHDSASVAGSVTAIQTAAS